MAENNSDEFSFSDAAGQETYEQLEADDTATGDETIASNGAAAASDEQGVDDPVGHNSRSARYAYVVFIHGFTLGFIVRDIFVCLRSVALQLIAVRNVIYSQLLGLCDKLYLKTCT